VPGTASNNPGLSVNCPACGNPTSYVGSVPSADRIYIKATLMSPQLAHIYECYRHGPWRLDLDGVFRPHPSVNPATRR